MKNLLISLLSTAHFLIHINLGRELKTKILAKVVAANPYFFKILFDDLISLFSLLDFLFYYFLSIIFCNFSLNSNDYLFI